MSFVLMGRHYPMPEHRQALAREMGEMREPLPAKPGRIDVGPPCLTEDGDRLVGLSTWHSKQAFPAAGLTVGASDAIPAGATRPRHRFHLHAVTPPGRGRALGVSPAPADWRSAGERGP